MKYQLDKKPFNRISKSAIRRLIGKMLDYSVKYETIYSLDIDKYADSKDEKIKEYIKLHDQVSAEQLKTIPDATYIHNCEISMSNIAKEFYEKNYLFTYSKRIYHNDRHKYNLYAEEYALKRIPKSAIRTYLFLYSCPQNVLHTVDGDTHFIRDISDEMIADGLSICPVTVRKCISILSDLHFIDFSHASSNNSYNIIINAYDDMHLTAKEGGTGYVTLTSEIMTELLSIENVNALRLELLKILKNDEDLRNKQTSSSYKIKELKNIMPAHTNYPAKYRSFDKTQKSIFSSSVEHGQLNFCLKQNYCLRVSLDDYILKNYDLVKDLILTTGFKVNDSQIYSVCDMTCEYTIQNIKTSLEQMFSDYSDKLHTILNFGALLRTYCQRNYIRIAA